MSFVGVEPIEVLRFRDTDWVVYVTLGMSNRPLPDAGDGNGVSEVSTDGPRAELLLRVRADTLAATEVWRALALLAAAPVVEGLRYEVGAIVSLAEPLAPGTRTQGVVVVEPRMDLAASGGLVTVFEVLPATGEELAWARVHGVPALRARWREQAVDLTDLGRRQADLR